MGEFESRSRDGDGGTSSEFDLVEFLNEECEAALASRDRLSRKVIELNAEIRALREEVATEHAKAG